MAKAIALQSFTYYDDPVFKNPEKPELGTAHRQKQNSVVKGDKPVDVPDGRLQEFISKGLVKKA